MPDVNGLATFETREVRVLYGQLEVILQNSERHRLSLFF